MTDPSATAGFPPPQPWPPPVVPRRAVPATVQAAVIVTYVCSALTVLMTLFFLLVAAFIGSVVLESFGTASLAGFAVFVVGAAIVGFVGSALACWFAWQTGRGRGWARVALAVCSGVAAVVSLLSFGPHTAVVLPGSAAVLVLLFVPQSHEWFRTP